LNFGRFSSLRGAKRRSNLDFRVFEIATVTAGSRLLQNCRFTKF